MNLLKLDETIEQSFNRQIKKAKADGFTHVQIKFTFTDVGNKDE